MSLLGEICRRKKAHIEERRKIVALENLGRKIAGMPEPLGFLQALKRHQPPAIIAEVKKASPSKGIIRMDFDAVEIAKIYQENGAACISVLTDEPYFQGRDEYLEQIKAAVSLPLLRKDFMLEEYQIFESRALGADCILLIMAALSDRQALKLYECARSLDLDVLVEIHDEEELERALQLDPMMIGINNRNLKTLDVDMQTSHRLAGKIPEEILKIAESGISDAAMIRALQKNGFEAFLVGESLMREEDIGMALKSLRI